MTAQITSETRAGQEPPGGGLRPPDQVDWRARAWIDGFMASGWPRFADRTVEQARDDLRFLIRATSVWLPVRSVGEAVIASPRADIPVRIYVPLSGTSPRPLLVWFHGGGFTVGDLETADPTCRALANRSGAVVVSVDYRLAPEHGILDAVDDACAATQWAIRNAAALGCDPGRVAVGGDSAGATLSALVCLRCRDNGEPSPAFQVLVYPCTDCTMQLCDRGIDRPLLDWATIDWFREHCRFSGPSPVLDGADPRISAYRAPDHSGLPPALVLTGGADLLAPDGEAYAQRLRAAGVAVSERRFEGQIHGFFTMDLVFRAARQAQRLAAQAIAAMPRRPAFVAPPAPPAAAVTWVDP
ncbi:MAG TPA: alpha/beta hydrolase, partial [Vineibacter sp.]|nr:alpha/beta hydrolase [Vineibacter sp.]